MRATTHSGRISSSARHNDRDFEIEKTEHIDKSRLEENIYYSCYDGMSFQEAETKFYNVHFSEMMDDINLRAERSRHLERKTNASKLLASQKTMPEEIIWQIGNKDDHTPKETVIEVFKEFHEWHDKKFGNHVKTLNWALHADEETPHIHERRVWTYQDEKGFTSIGQHKALSQLGYSLPDQTKERGKKNNLKMVYSAECREKWLEICEKYNLTIERTPEKRAPDEQNLLKNDFILQKQNKEISSNALALKNQETDLKRGVLKMHLQESKIEKVNDEVISLGNIKTQLLETIDNMRGQSALLQKDVQVLKLQKSDLTNEILQLKGSHEKLKIQESELMDQISQGEKNSTELLDHIKELKNNYEYNNNVILQQNNLIKSNKRLLEALKGEIGVIWEKITSEFQHSVNYAFKRAKEGYESSAHSEVDKAKIKAVNDIQLPANGLTDEKLKDTAVDIVNDTAEKAHDTITHIGKIRRGR